jgi:hypothetical protein
MDMPITPQQWAEPRVLPRACASARVRPSTRHPLLLLGRRG